MNLKIFLSLLTIFFFLSITVSAQVTIFSGNEDWQKLLKIEDDEDYLAGLTLTQTIDPDIYYKQVGDEIRVSGYIRSIFGALSDALIIIEQRNATSLCKQIPVVTDPDGYYIITDTLDVAGKISYQSVFSHDTEFGPVNVSSPKIELLVFEGEDEIEASDEYFIPEIIDNSYNKNETHKNYSPSLSFSSTSESYSPGEIISLNGSVSDISGKPEAYKRIQIALETPGSDKTSGYERSMTYHTESDGTINVSYHLTGPYPIGFFMELPATGLNPKEVSEKISISPISFNFSPPSRIIHEKEQIDAYLVSNSVKTDENITLHGWYTNHDGSAGILLPLEFVWYNFGGRIWDKFQNSTDIITNADGYFSCTLTAPSTLGVYLLSIRTKKTVTKSHVYSNILNLIVREPEIPIEPWFEFNNPIFSLHATPQIGKAGEMTQLTIVFSDSSGNPVMNHPVQLYQSDNGIEWRILSDSLVTNESGQIVIGIIPEITGYQYYRALTQVSDGETITSETLVIPVL